MVSAPLAQMRINAAAAAVTMTAARGLPATSVSMDGLPWRADDKSFHITDNGEGNDTTEATG